MDRHQLILSKKNCPLQFADVQLVDHAKICPVYNSVLTRSNEEGVHVEELDNLQCELQDLLDAANTRLSVLEEELRVLVDWQETGKDKSHHPKKKRKALFTRAKYKRSRDGRFVPLTNAMLAAAVPLTMSHSPSSTFALSDHDSPQAATPPLVKIQHSDLPNRFWASLEPYACDITEEHIKHLDNLLKLQEDETDYYKIPTVIKPFSQKWAEDDLQAEQKEGVRPPSKGKSSHVGGTNGNSGHIGVERLLKNGVNHQGGGGGDTPGPNDGCPYGPLTQRLISALVEENIITPLNEYLLGGGDASSQTPNNGGSASAKTSSKVVSAGYARLLENKIRNELVQLGFLDADDVIDEEREDEVLCELKRKQSELKALSAHNKAMKLKLYTLAKAEMNKQSLKKQLNQADSEVMEAFRRLMAAKQKKRPVSKKEREVAWKALKERDSIIKLLEASP